MRFAGIDGCKAGWVAVVANGNDLGFARLAVAPTLAELIAAQRIEFGLVDMPIGLSSGPTPRDVEPSMRQHLKGKSSSVFNTPCRQALEGATHLAASAINAGVLGKRLSVQTFSLFPKLREVDATVLACGQSCLREGHPEVSFSLMAGSPVKSPKKLREGKAERVTLLEARGIPVLSLLQHRPSRVGEDDILDAAALLWSAVRFGNGTHELFPPSPLRDSAGLEMSVIA